MWGSESQFADSFEAHLHLHGEALRRQGKGAAILREYEPGYGRVDMVLVVYDVDRLHERRRRSPLCAQWSELDSYCAYVMAYLTRTRWVSVNRLGSRMNVGFTRITQLVSDLKCRGLIETRSELVKAHAMQVNWVIDYIETFELKLSNWQRALEQAGRHLWFASQSYVVMPGRSETLARRLSQHCGGWNVGAILGEAHDRWETLVCPPRADVPISHIGWLLNELIVSEETYA